MSRVVHLTSVHQPFDGRIFHKECRSLAAAGHQVTLIAPADDAERLRQDVRVVGVPRPASQRARPRTWRLLLQRTVALQPDIVHFHDPELLLLVPLLRLQLGRRVRIVYDVHEYLAYAVKDKVWIPPWLRDPAAVTTQWIERALGRGVDGLVFVMQEQEALYRSWPAHKVLVHNYPPPDIFADARPLPDFPPDRFRLIYLGSLHERRNLMTMLEALVLLVRQVPEALLILGGRFESAHFQARIERFIAEHGLQEYVHLLGWVDHAQVKHYLASADVGWLGGFGSGQYQQQRIISSKQLEFMLMGLPIVSGDNPNYARFVDEAQCGLVVKADDPHAHAEALLWLHRHPQERMAMGRQGHELVLSKYTWESEAHHLQQFYRTLLAAGSGVS